MTKTPIEEPSLASDAAPDMAPSDAAASTAEPSDATATIATLAQASAKSCLSKILLNIKERINALGLDASPDNGHEEYNLKVMALARDVYAGIELAYNLAINSVDDEFYKKKLKLPFQQDTMRLKMHIYDMAFKPNSHSAWLAMYDLPNFKAFRSIAAVPECADMFIALEIDAPLLLKDIEYEVSVFERITSFIH